MADSDNTFAGPGSGHPDRRLLRDFALGQLSVPELESCAGHLETCETCRAIVETVPADPLMMLVRRAAPAGDQGDPRRLLQKYEVLEEIGRGGTAVVFKARHLGLGRTVALKQIKADAITAEELTRFRAEASALARLRHPNIVQIYDVGEQDGRPYLACEFVAGGSLDRYMAGNPLPPRSACRLTATLARAVQVAHEHSVIHRDLKPSNVLLETDGRKIDPGDEHAWETVVPKIGDFGLAKHLDQVQVQTRTGAVMGTPGYMAPEQATGNAAHIGPGIDVFALGVMLYELLTGRRPFQGATIAQTFEMIRTADPVPPKRWQPALPRDLEIVCLKCLEKDPARRYGTAGELADDLDHWLNGLPIRARPVPNWERGWKWARRHPAVSVLLGTLVMSLVALFVGLYWHTRTLEKEVRRANANESVALAASGKGYDAIKDILNELMEDYTDTELTPRTRGKLSEIFRAYHASTLEGADQANPEVRLARAGSLLAMGAMQQSNGGLDDAVKLLDAARQELEPLEDRIADKQELHSRLAACYRGLAMARSSSGPPDRSAIDLMQRACRLLEGLVQAQPQDVGFRRRQAGALHDLASLYVASGQTARAEQPALEARAVQRSIERMAPLRTGDRLAFERTVSFLARLRCLEGRFDAADELLQEGESLFSGPAAGPRSNDADAALADLLDLRCLVEQGRGRTMAALRHRTRSIELLRKVLSESPKHRFAHVSLPAYEASQRELLSRLLGSEGAPAAAEISALAARLAEVRALRAGQRLDDAAAELREIETRLDSLRATADSLALEKCLAETHFEWAELHIGTSQLDAAVARYDQCIAVLTALIQRVGKNGWPADFLSNCQRLKAWHLSRAGRVEAAFAAWDLAVENVVGPARDYLRIERALERAMLEDHVRAVAEADQVAAEASLRPPALLHLARVYSVSVRAVSRDIRLAAHDRQELADYCADQAVRCLRRLASDPNADETLLANLDADPAFAALRDSVAYKSWQQELRKDDEALAK